MEKISILLKAIIPLYLEFLRNLSGFIILMLISAMGHFLLDMYPQEMSNPKALGYFSFIMMGIGILTYLLNCFNFYNGCETKIKEISLDKHNIIRFFIYFVMFVFAIFLLPSILYYVSIQGYKLLSGL